MATEKLNDGVDILVNEMGFSRSEAEMAITECSGNIELAVEKLLSGEYAPPPYCEIENDSGAASGFSPVVSPNGIDLSIGKGLKSKKEDDVKNCNLIDSNPPPYTKICLKTELMDWESKCSADFFDLGGLHNNSAGTAVGRCSTCFDEIFEKEKAGFSNKAVKDGIRTYHYDCYMKSRGPKCSYCCFPLSKPDLDKNISGKFLIYEGKKYHVECYEKYAGPRCSYCFNVIIETPNREFTGNWIGEGHKMFHEECFYKKRYSDERAKCV